MKGNSNDMNIKRRDFKTRVQWLIRPIQWDLIYWGSDDIKENKKTN